MFIYFEGEKARGCRRDGGGGAESEGERERIPSGLCVQGPILRTSPANPEPNQNSSAQLTVLPKIWFHARH